MDAIQSLELLPKVLLKSISIMNIRTIGVFLLLFKLLYKPYFYILLQGVFTHLI